MAKGEPREKRYPVMVYNVDPDADDNYPILVIVNGHAYSIKPQTRVSLPMSAIEALEHACEVIPAIPGVTDAPQVKPRFIVSRVSGDMEEAGNEAPSRIPRVQEREAGEDEKES